MPQRMMKEISAGKSQKRRRMVLRRTARCSREFAATSATEIPSEKKNNGLYLFRDSSSIEPPATAYEPDRGDNKLNFNIYAEVANPKFIVCPEDIWMPKMEDTAGISLLLTQFKPRIELHVERLKRSTARVLDHGATLFVVFVGTFWTLFAEDVAHGWPLDKTVDTPFAWASLFFLLLFVAEQATRSIVQREDYLLSLFWWMELVRLRCSNACPCSARDGANPPKRPPLPANPIEP